MLQNLRCVNIPSVAAVDARMSLPIRPSRPRTFLHLQLEASRAVESLLSTVELKFEQQQLDSIQQDLQQLFELAQDCVKVRKTCWCYGGRTVGLGPES